MLGSPRPYKVVGGDGSPYSCKLRGVFRYRRIPFLWTPQYVLSDKGMGSVFDTHFPKLRARVIPVMVRPDGTYANDSTPLILELEDTFSERALVPKNAGQAFLAALVEDFSDEWMTKCMFETRFHNEKDSYFGAAWQFWQGAPVSTLKNGVTPAAIDKSVLNFSTRQNKRKQRIVGSEYEVIEFCIRKVCSIIEQNVRDGNPFLFGNRATNGDFGLFGQFSQMHRDISVCAIVQEYPIAWSWFVKMDDLSGTECPDDDGNTPNEAPKAVLEILSLASKTYLPFMEANFNCYQKKEENFTIDLTIDGKTYKHSQPPFKYQAVYCWPMLMKQYNELSGNDRAYVDKVLKQTGCYDTFATNATNFKASL